MSGKTESYEDFSGEKPMDKPKKKKHRPGGGMTINPASDNYRMGYNHAIYDMDAYYNDLLQPLVYVYEEYKECQTVQVLQHCFGWELERQWWNAIKTVVEKHRMKETTKAIARRVR